MNKMRGTIGFLLLFLVLAFPSWAQNEMPVINSGPESGAEVEMPEVVDMSTAQPEPSMPIVPDPESEAVSFGDESPSMNQGSGSSSGGVLPLPSTTKTMTFGDDLTIDVLELKNMDVTDVLKLVSQKSGINVVAGSEVKGKVTIFLKSVKLKDALRIILDSNSLAYSYENGILRVMSASEFERRYGYKFGGEIQTKIIRLLHSDVNDTVTLLNQMKSPAGKIISDPKSSTVVILDSPEKVEFMENLVKEVDVPIETKVFELTYASVKDVSEKINEVLTKNVGSMRFDERSKKIVVKDTPSKMVDVTKIVEAFDVKRREVLIEAKIVQVDLTNGHEFGVDWQAISAKYHQLKFESHFPGISATDSTWGKITIGNFEDDNYNAILGALETIGQTKVLSNPRISALDNEEAKIMVGQAKPYATSSTTTSSTGPATTAVSVNFIDVGVKLSVTPTIHKDDFITMKIRPEVSSATRNYEARSGTETNLIPIKESSEAETTVMVKDGVTIVIGGLIKEDKTHTINKVPLLGDIPFLGTAFRSTTETSTKSEIVIFLTPHIITGDVPSERTEARRRKYQMIPEAIGK